MNVTMKKKLNENGDLTICKKCGKDIWKYWHVKNKWEIHYPPMTKCAPCYFDK